MTSQRLNPVAWKEGMFLRPQHLQRQDLYVEERLNALARSLDPFHWGVRSFEIDEEALSDNRLEVLSMDAVLPGGTVIRFPGNAAIESREFNPEVEALEVYVGIRRISASDANTASSDSQTRDIRYRVRSENVPDLNRAGVEAPVDMLVPNLRIFLSGEELELESCEWFQLARIRATGSVGRPFGLEQGYAPPLLALQAWPPLLEEVGKITSQLAAKIRVVAGRTTTVSTADLPKMWMRYTLARMTPVLRHLLSTGASSPFAVYTALIEVAGALAAFAQQEAVELPTYRHDNLSGCYGELLAFIEVHLGEAVPERFAELQLGFEAGAGKNFYATRELSTELVDPRNSFFLGIKASIESKDLLQLVAESAKAASIGEVEPLRMMNLEGLTIEHLPGPPTEIAGRTGFEYFKIEPHGRLWNRVREEYSFALSVGKLENADVRLYVVTHEA